MGFRTILRQLELQTSQLDIQQYIDAALALPRYDDPRRLSRHGFKAYSQGDEDGIIAEIFRRISAPKRTFVEFGVQTGIECNSLYLLAQGWSGLWIDADRAACAAIKKDIIPHLRPGALTLINDYVKVDNINALIGGHYSGGDLDFLSIDIDHNDYWVWQAIDVVRPRVVCIEYNAIWRPPVSVTVPYEAEAGWSGSNYFGVSLAALNQLGHAKGYDLVGCSLTGANAFFVRSDLIGAHFFKPGSAEAHFEPARYFLAQQTAGHRPGFGPLASI
ncbi:MAG: hypothetical protein JWO72_1269 [Caulobacteraceae bacterium]|nr:hypothetical protein [Caulobacteraceae bacterium]